MSTKDWALLTISIAGEKGLTPAQLQKSLFLLQKALKRNGPSYKFQPYHYGPFDVEVYKDSELLASEDLVRITCKEGYNWGKYYITEAGLKKANELKSKFKSNTLDYIVKLVKWVQGKSFQELISSIYKRYPEFKKNSVFNSLSDEG